MLTRDTSIDSGKCYPIPAPTMLATTNRTSANCQYCVGATNGLLSSERNSCSICWLVQITAYIERAFLVLQTTTLSWDCIYMICSMHVTSGCVQLTLCLPLWLQYVNKQNPCVMCPSDCMLEVLMHLTTWHHHSFWSCIVYQTRGIVCLYYMRSWIAL